MQALLYMLGYQSKWQPYRVGGLWIVRGMNKHTKEMVLLVLYWAKFWELDAQGLKIYGESFCQISVGRVYLFEFYCIFVNKFC